MAERADSGTPEIAGAPDATEGSLQRPNCPGCGEPLHAQKLQLDNEIRALLRPDQQTRYDQFIKDSEARFPPDGPPEPMP